MLSAFDFPGCRRKRGKWWRRSHISAIKTIYYDAIPEFRKNRPEFRNFAGHATEWDAEALIAKARNKIIIFKITVLYQDVIWRPRVLRQDAPPAHQIWRNICFKQ
jgi:hypothetical protein